MRNIKELQREGIEASYRQKERDREREKKRKKLAMLLRLISGVAWRKVNSGLKMLIESKTPNLV